MLTILVEKPPSLICLMNSDFRERSLNENLNKKLMQNGKYDSDPLDQRNAATNVEKKLGGEGKDIIQLNDSNS